MLQYPRVIPSAGMTRGYCSIQFLPSSPGSGCRRSFSKSESFVWREQSKLESKRKIFLQQKEEFEKEKQKFMEAVCKLDRERQVFEDEKATFLREQLLDVSILSSTKELDSFFSHMSSTPAQSFAQRTRVVKKRVHTKSTTSEVDLQHDLSLCSDDGTSVLNERPYTDLPEDESSDQD